VGTWTCACVSTAIYNNDCFNTHKGAFVFTMFLCKRNNNFTENKIHVIRDTAGTYYNHYLLKELSAFRFGIFRLRDITFAPVTAMVVNIKVHYIFSH